MVLTTIRDMELVFRHVDATSHTLNPKTVSWSETADDKVGEWGALLKNPRSRIAGKIRAGDEVEVWLKKDAEGVLTKVFLGVVGPIGRDFRQGKMSEFDVKGLAWEARLFDRHVTLTVSSSKDVGQLIVDTLTSNDLGLDLSLIDTTWGTSVSDVAFDYVTIHEFLTRLAGMVSAHWYVDVNKRLHFDPIGTVSSGITEDGSGIADFKNVIDPETIINVQRGYGGTSKVKHLEQTTNSSYSRVTGTTALATKVRWPADQVALFKVFAQAVAGSASSLEFRIESDDSGTRSGVSITRVVVSASEIPSVGAFVAFFPPAHIIGPGTDVWFVVQGTDANGVDVAVDGSSVMKYEAYIGYPVASEKKNQTSIDAYGRREGRPIRDADITSLEEINLRIDVVLAKFAEPTHIASFFARDPAYLTAALGSYVTFAIPEIGSDMTSKQLTIHEKKVRVDNHQYRLEILVSDGERDREIGNQLAELLRRVEFLEASNLRANSQVLQLRTADDSMGATDSTATITATATGSFQYDTAKFDMAEYG